MQRSVKCKMLYKYELSNLDHKAFQTLAQVHNTFVKEKLLLFNRYNIDRVGSTYEDMKSHLQNYSLQGIGEN